MDSVHQQSYSNIEYIVIDGGSKDGTVELIRQKSAWVDVFVSEKDQGMYDALNKGIALAKGEIIGLLHADDVLASINVVETIVNAFRGDVQLKAVIGDIEFEDERGRPKRYCSARDWRPSDFRRGMMPPHPSFYCLKSCYNLYGGFRLDFEIAADFELLLRFLKVASIRFQYLPVLMVRMRLGGKSTKNWRSNYVINQEIQRACELNGLKTNYFLIYSKYFRKIKEFF